MQHGNGQFYPILDRRPRVRQAFLDSPDIFTPEKNHQTKSRDDINKTLPAPRLIRFKSGLWHMQEKFVCRSQVTAWLV